jgi:hypothetical protein
MKKALQYTFLIAFFFLSSVISLQAQPHPGKDSGNNNVGGNRIGNGAPVGNGTFILLVLAIAYGGRKMYQTRATEEE